MFGPDASSILLTTCMIGAPAITFCVRMSFLIRERHALFHFLLLIGAILLTILVQQSLLSVDNFLLSFDFL